MTDYIVNAFRLVMKYNHNIECGTPDVEKSRKTWTETLGNCVADVIHVYGRWGETHMCPVGDNKVEVIQFLFDGDELQKKTFVTDCKGAVESSVRTVLWEI